MIYRAQISNGLWPTTPSNLLVTWIVLVCMLYWDNKYIQPVTLRLWAFGDFIYLDQSHHLLLRIFGISLIAAIGFFIVLLYARQYALRILLSYRGWMCKCIYSTGVFSVVIVFNSSVFSYGSNIVNTVKQLYLPSWKIFVQSTHAF